MGYMIVIGTYDSFIKDTNSPIAVTNMLSLMTSDEDLVKEMVTEVT